MHYSISKKLSYFLLSFSLVLSNSSNGALIADDTEIYFSAGTSSAGTIDQTILPNIMFILDTSGSMGSSVPQAGGDQRIKVLKDAMRQIIGDVEDVNLGLMRFTSGSGGPVLFPVSYIDENVGNIVSETAVPGELSYEAYISDGENDGEENNDGAGDDGEMSLGDVVIEAIEIGTGTAVVGSTANISERVDSTNEDAEENISDGDMTRYDNDLDFRTSGSTELAGVLFDGLSLPANSIIEHAYLDFWIKDKKTSTTNVVIKGFDTDNPSDFSNSDYDISSRTKTSASVTWTGLPAANKNKKITSPDIKDIVQEIVSRGCTVAPAAAPVNTNCTFGEDKMGFIITTTTGSRSVKSRDNSSSKAPRLRIEYTTATTVASPGDEQIIGLRFEDIKIPQGATITDASLVFTPSDDGTGATTWDIKAENPTSGNSDEFEITANNFSSRTLTGNTAKWVVPSWTDGVPIETTDNGGSANELKDIVQTAVDNGNWCGGNAMSFFITSATNPTTSLREIVSHEGDSSSAVKFKYSYTSGTGNCYATTETGQSGIVADDAEQNGTTVTINGTDLSLGIDTVGVRFQAIDIPVDATITAASIQFYAKTTDSSAASFTIKGELPSDADSNVFTTTDNDISSRTLTTTGNVTWVPDPWDTVGEIYETSDITSIVSQMITTAAGWTSGADLGFVIETGTGTRSAESFDSNPALAPRLKVTYSDTADSAYKTVRERLIELVDDLPASGSTPVTETLTEAAHYWRGEHVDWGKSRANSSSARISHPASYCASGSPLDCRGATVSNTALNPDSDIYGIQTPNGCNPATNLNDSDCKTRKIAGSPKYISPFSSTLTCQNNYQVLLTDGEANSSSSSSRDDIETIIGSNSCLSNNSTFKSAGDSSHNYTADEKCGPDLVKYLKENDQSTSSVGTGLDGNQTVKTYTIGFNLGSSASALANTQYLKDMANLGDGQYFDATTAGSLVDVFNTILTDVKSDPSSFSAPSIAVNTFNRLFSRDDIYFGLFTPALEKRWEGNLKKYNVCTNSNADGIVGNADDCTLGNVLDANLVEAVVEDSSAVDDGEFKTTATSEWTNAGVAPDGRTIDLGGAGGEITNYTSRVIYTDINNSGTPATGTALSGSGLKITATNWTGSDTALTKVRSTVCTGTHTPPDAACTDLMSWMLGKDVDDEDGDGSFTDTRFWFSDVLHSSPNVMTYGFDTPNDKFIDKILVGSNNGGLHFINGDSGVEEWSFMPNSMLANQSSLKTNLTGTHTYGLDATPILRVEDADLDGNIESGDKVHVFMSQRRGGSSVYGLDISAVIANATSTTSVVPKLLWRIDAVDNSAGALGSATGNFSRLGQTWSDANVADIKTASGSKTVLIFGGGYDTNLDEFDGVGNKKFGLEAGTPNQGNAIYVVDAETGKLIFWISHAANAGAGIASSGADIQVPNMYYAIPSNITVFDTDGDGFDDRMYVGDTAGKVWRVDLGSDIDPTKTSGSSPNAAGGPQGSTVAGQFADLSVAGTVANERRIFFRPSVVQVRDTTFSNAANGEFDYVVVSTGNRANPLFRDTSDRLYALRDAQIGTLTDAGADNLADDYPSQIDGTSNSSAPIANADLVPITLTTGLTGTTFEKNAEGWYLDFDTTGTDGEKALAAPRVLFGTILFSTYVPEDGSQIITGAEACEAQVGDGRAFNLGILTAAPTLNWDGDPNTNSPTDAVMTLGAGGIPPEVVPVYTTEGVTYLFGKEPPPGKSDNDASQTYWYQE